MFNAPKKTPPPDKRKRVGKTAKDRANGAHQRAQANREARAEQNRAGRTKKATTK